ncbi:MAG TPA: MFS transporter [Candidatus Dorea intestinavium]|nr:MFS transporter [Candidatus Dorea intestinavium]
MTTKETRGIFVRCYYIFFVNGILTLLIGSLLPFIRDTYGLDYQIGGFLVSAHAIGNLVSSFLGGILPIKFGRKNTLIFLGTFGVIAFVLMTRTSNPALLILAFFFTGVNRGAVSNFNNSVVNEVATGKAWALNLLHAVFSIGAFLAPFLVLIFTKNNPHNWMYMALTEAALILTSLLIVFFMNVPNNYPAAKDGSKTDWSFLKNKYFIVATGIIFFYLCAEQSINGWLVTYLQDSGILSSQFSQVMTSVLWLVILIGRLLTAFVSTKIKKQYLLLGTSIGYVIFALILLFVHHSVITSIGVVGVGLFMAGIYATTIASIGDVVKEYPTCLGMLLTIGSFGAIIMPSIVGTVAKHTGIKGGMAVIIIAIAINMLFMVANVIIRKDEKQL